MEESIRRAEKLVHATNSALAQMKYNLTFDNVKREPQVPVRTNHSDRGKKKVASSFNLQEELQQFEEEFKLEANEMLSKMDKLLEAHHYGIGSNRYSQAARARDKMKEINRKLIGGRTEPRSSETEESKQKLLNLINEEDFKQTTNTSSKHTLSSRNSKPSREAFPVRDVQSKGKLHSKGKIDHHVENPPHRDRSKEELKIKLLETQEIVDRGFLTARQLTQRVENMSKGEKKIEKTPNSEKTFVSDATFAKSLVQDRKSESNETIRTLDSSERKCSKCQRLKEKRRNRNKKEECERSLKYSEMADAEEERNNCLVKIRRPESRRLVTAPKLNLQRLPSVTIKGGLQMQKVHELEILPETGRKATPIANTATTILSHEEIEREKAKKALEDIEKQNCFCQVKDNDRINRIECFKCGNLIRIQETSSNPRELDKLLQKCGFNVFDPRIDEFVANLKGKGLERECARKVEENQKKEEIQEPRGEEVMKQNIEEEKTKEKPKEAKPQNKTFTIKELSQKLTRKYQEKTDELEENHQELDNILKSLFKKIDDSRKLFGNHQVLSTDYKDASSWVRKQTLQMTKPVVVCLSENAEAKTNADPTDGTHQEKAIETDRTSQKKRSYRKKKERGTKLDKSDAKVKCKNRTADGLTYSDFRLLKFFSGEMEESKLPGDEDERLKGSLQVSSEYPPLGATIMQKIYEQQEREKKEREKKNSDLNAPRRRTSSEDTSASTESIREERLCEELGSDVETKTENDYESDFEGESLTQKNDGSHGVEEVEVAKKLSTISEVDSEFEKKDGKSTTTERTLDTPEVDELDLFTKNEAIKHEIADVVNKAFEKGVAYTVRHQSNVLEDMKGRYETPEVAISNSALTAPESNRHSAASLDETKSSSPKSQVGKSDHLKSWKSKSETSVSQKSSSTEVVASLKEVLSALKDQFERTQTLADKLTENVKTLKTEKEKSLAVESGKVEAQGGPMTWQITADTGLDTDIISNLKMLRKDLSEPNSPKRQKSLFTLAQTPRNEPNPKDGANHQSESRDLSEILSLSDDDEPSIGEVLVQESGARSISSEFDVGSGINVNEPGVLLSFRKDTDKVQVTSPQPMPVRNDEAYYSEGEIPSNIVLEAEGSSTQSIGELISENISVESGLS